MKAIIIDFNNGAKEEIIERRSLTELLMGLRITETPARNKAILNFDLKKPYIVKRENGIYCFISNEEKEFEEAARKKARKKYDRN